MDWSIIKNFFFEINKQGSTEYILTIISISVAAFIIFLSLSVIPFQKISDEISGTLYKLFLKQKKFLIPVFLILSICILQIVFYPIAKDSKFVKFIYLGSLIFILVSAFFYTKIIKEQLDISYSIYPLIIKDLEKSVKKLKKREFKIKKNLNYQEKEQKKLLSISILYQINIEKYPLKLPVDFYAQIFTYKFQTIYEVLINSLEKYQYGSYEKAIECLFSCIKSYFSYIDNHLIISDSVFLEFEGIIQILFEKNKEKNNSIYQDILINNLTSFSTNLKQYTINHDFYYERIIKLYFSKVINLNSDFVININRIMSLIPIFTKKDESLKLSFEVFYNYALTLLVSIYKENNSLKKTLTNKLINSFSYEILINKLYLSDEDILQKVYYLQSLIDANNVYAPLPGEGVNDFSTSIETIGEDKTLCSAVRKTFPYYINELPNDYPLKYLNYLDQIITILIKRYEKGGTYKKGLRDQLYCIYFYIYTLLDENTFYFIYNTNIKFYVPNNEKDKLINLLMRLLEFETKIDSECGEAYLLCEIKFLLILFSAEKNVISSIIKNKDVFMKIIARKKTDYKFKIAIYSYFKTLLPQNQKKGFKEHIKLLYKRNKSDYPHSELLETKYDTSKMNISFLNIPQPMKDYYKDYVNTMVLNHVAFKRKSIKKEILLLQYPMTLNQLLIVKSNINSIFLYGLILELIDEQKLIIGTDQETIYKEPGVAGGA